MVTRHFLKSLIIFTIIIIIGLAGVVLLDRFEKQSEADQNPVLDSASIAK